MYVVEPCLEISGMPNYRLIYLFLQKPFAKICFCKKSIFAQKPYPLMTLLFRTAILSISRRRKK